MQGFIDRIVDGVAVILLDGGGRAYLPVSQLPAGLAGGSFVEMTLSSMDVKTGAESAEEMAALIERLRSGEHRHG